MVKRIPTFTSKCSFNFVKHPSGQGDSKPNVGKALSILATQERLAMVLPSTGGDGAKLGSFDESFHEGILLTG
jgi:hypothetical protein